MTITKTMLTYSQAAQWYGVTKRHLQQLRADGKITAHKRPRRNALYFETDELDAVLGKPTADELINNALSHLPHRYHAPVRILIKELDQNAPICLDFIEYVEPPDLDKLMAQTEAQLQRALDALDGLPTAKETLSLLDDLEADIDLDDYD